MLLLRSAGFVTWLQPLVKKDDSDHQAKQEKAEIGEAGELRKHGSIPYRDMIQTVHAL